MPHEPDNSTRAALLAKGCVADPATGELFAPGHYRVKRAAVDLPIDNPREAPQLEQSLRHGALGEVSNEAPTGGRFLVRVTSIRKRLLDEDNLCEKFLVDCCRHSGLIPGDGPGQTKIEVRQEKAEPGSRERVVTEIFKI